MRRLVSIVLFVAMAACGGAGTSAPATDGPTSPASTTTREVESTPTEPLGTDPDPRVTSAPSERGQVPSPTTVELSLGKAQCGTDTGEVMFVDAEFAFVGTITSISGESEPWDVDGESPDRPATPDITPWVSFAVDGWYTNDWGTTFNVWMPLHAVEVGQRLAVGGDARYVAIENFSGQSGEVEVCSSAADGAFLPSWDSFFGTTIVAGAGVPEGEPDPEAVANIDAAEAAWNTLGLDSYSYLVSLYDRARSPDACNGTSARVVVEDGELVEAVGIQSGFNADFGCPLQPSRVPSIAELFDRARELAGALSFSFSNDPENGTVLNFYASDRSVDVQIAVTRLSESTDRLVAGWDDVTAAASSARALWSSKAFDHQVHISDSNGERKYFFITTTVVGGEVVEVRDGDTVIDPTTLQQPWTPFTVDGVFDLIASMEGQGNVAAVFDTETGAPINVWFDPILNGVDDELAKTVTVTQL